jgi:hypothetical protein
MKRTPLIVLAVSLSTGLAFAQSEREEHHRHQLPEEAFTACGGLKEGDACIARPGGTEVKGSCTLGHETRLWCRSTEPPSCPPQ